MLSMARKVTYGNLGDEIEGRGKGVLLVDWEQAGRRAARIAANMYLRSTEGRGTRTLVKHNS